MNPIATPQNPVRRRVLAATLLSLGLALTGASLRAAAYTWDPTFVPATPAGGAGTWNLSLVNWSNGTTDQAWTDTTGTADTATFGGTAGTVTVGSNLGALGLIFTTPGYTLATGTNTLTLGSSGIDASALSSGTTTISGKVALGSNQSWNVGSGSTLTSSAVISGTGGLTASGLGTLILSAANTFSGGLTISSGTLAVSSNTFLGGAAGTAGAIALNGGTLQMNLGTASQTNTHVITVGASGGTIQVTSTSGQPTLSLGSAGNLLGSGNLTILGNGTLTQAGSAGASVFVMANANTGYSGNITIGNGGVIEYANATAIPTTSSFTVNNLGLLSANSVTIAQAVTVNNGGFLGFQNAGTGVFSGAITLNGNATVRLQNWWSSATQTGTISGAIGGTGNLTVNSGSGTGATLNLSNAGSTYTGATTITNSIVNVGTFGNVNTASSLGNGSAGGSAADLVLSGGTLRYTGATAQSTNRLFSVGNSGGTLDASGSNNANPLAFTGTGAMGFNSQTGARTLTLTGTNTGDNILDLAIGDNSGATSITKTGAGTWALGGTNTYSGATTVSAGMLSFLNTAAKSASTTVTAAAGAGVGLGVGGAGFYGSSDIDSLFANTLTGFNLNATSLIGIDTTAGNFTYATGQSGTQTLVKLGANTLTLSGANTYTGATNVNAGTLNISGSLAGATAITVNNGGTLSETNTGVIGSGAATLTVTSGGTATLAGANTYTGATTISGGTLQFNGASAMSSGSVITLNTGTLSLNSDATNPTFTPGGNLTITGATDTINVGNISSGSNQTVTIGAVAFNAGTTLNVTSSNGYSLTLSAVTTGGVSPTFSPTAGTTLNMGAITNTGGTYAIFNFGGAGTTNVTGAMTNSQTNRSLALVFNQTGTVTLSGSNNLRNNTNASDTNNTYINVNSGTTNFNNANAIFSNYAAPLNLNGGTIDNTSGGAIVLGGSHAIFIAADFTYGGTNNLDLGNNTTTLNGSAGFRTITTNGAATLTLSGAIINGTATGLTKAGTGTLALTGLNTYTGGTIINQGTLAYGANFTMNGANQISVAGAGTAGVNYGTIASTAGTLTFAGTLQLNVTASLSGNQSFNLFQSSGGTLAGDFTGVSIAGNYIASLTDNSGIWTGAANGINFTFTDSTGILSTSASAIPEPATVAVLLGCFALGLAALRRRQRRA